MLYSKQNFLQNSYYFYKVVVVVVVYQLVNTFLLSIHKKAFKLLHARKWVAKRVLGEWGKKRLKSIPNNQFWVKINSLLLTLPAPLPPVMVVMIVVVMIMFRCCCCWKWSEVMMLFARSFSLALPHSITPFFVALFSWALASARASERARLTNCLSCRASPPRPRRQCC